MTLRDSLMEMSMVLSDYQYDMDVSKRAAAMRQLDELLVRMGVTPEQRSGGAS